MVMPPGSPQFYPRLRRESSAKGLAVLLVVLASSQAFLHAPLLLLRGPVSFPPSPSSSSCWRGGGERGGRHVPFGSRQAAQKPSSGRRRPRCWNSDSAGRRRRASSTRCATSNRRDGDIGHNGDGAPSPVLSITTFNVLAPIFKRVGTRRESEFRETYLERHRAILAHLNVRARAE